MKRSRISKVIHDATETVAASIIDTTLTALYIGMVASTVHTMGDAMRSVEEVSSFRTRVNYQSIKRAIYSLSHQKLIRRSPKRTSLELSITKLGMQRIHALIPSYLTDRPWDEYVYLISYDIPRSHNATRDLLRRHIKQTGGALLQESLWINPYNPKILLEEFMNQHTVDGTILVSKLGKDGTIGEESLPELIYRIYNLEELANRYEEFLQSYKHQTSLPVIRCISEYFRILKDDPQLPFALLPNNFPALEAYTFIKPFLPHNSHSS